MTAGSAYSITGAGAAYQGQSADPRPTKRHTKRQVRRLKGVECDLQGSVFFHFSMFFLGWIFLFVFIFSFFPVFFCFYLRFFFSFSFCFSLFLLAFLFIFFLLFFVFACVSFHFSFCLTHGSSTQLSDFFPFLVSLSPLASLVRLLFSSPLQGSPLTITIFFRTVFPQFLIFLSFLLFILVVIFLSFLMSSSASLKTRGVHPRLSGVFFFFSCFPVWLRLILLEPTNSLNPTSLILSSSFSL